MRLYPDKWELAIGGVNTDTNRADYNTEPYDSETGARRAWSAVSTSSSSRFHITLAVIHPPVGSSQQPIVLRGTLPTQS